MDGVSVVIPCLNEELYIASCLKGLIQNGFDHSKLEIIVVDGGSSDKTLEIISELQKEHPFIKLIHNGKKKTPFALNLGVKNAAYNQVLIAGAHALYPVNYITKLNEHLKLIDIDVVGGSIETKAKTINPKTQAICYVLSHKFGVGNSIFRIGANKLLEVDTVPFGLYKKKVFENAGLYNELLIRNHDMELSSRIKANGYKIWMDPELKCTYYARENFRDLARNNYGNGLWNIKTLFITKKFSSLGLRHYIPVVFILSLLLPMALSFLNLCFAIVALSSFLLYFATILFLSIKAGGQKICYVIWSFITLHFSYGWGSLVGFFAQIKKSY